jgi:hypothetical protein
MRNVLLVLLTVLLPACGDSPTSQTPRKYVPPLFQITGFAEGDVEGTKIECSFNFQYQVDSTPLESFIGDRTYFGHSSGSAGRTVLWPNGSRRRFSPDLPRDSVILRLSVSDSLEVENPRILKSGTPFYKDLGLIWGRLTKETTGRGTWTCSPLESFGDDHGSIQGTWGLERDEERE